VCAQLLGAESPSPDPDCLGAYAARGVDVAGRVADDHHATFGDGLAQTRCAAFGTAPDDLDTLLVVAAKPAEAEVAAQIELLELDPSGAFHVAGTQPDGRAGRHDRLQRGLDSRIDAEVCAVGSRHLGVELSQVGLQKRVDGGFAGRKADRFQPKARCTAVGIAVEAQLTTSVAAAVQALERTLEGPAPEPAQVNEGSVDIEQQDGWTLQFGRNLGRRSGSAITNRAVNERFARQRVPRDMSFRWQLCAGLRAAFFSMATLVLLPHTAAAAKPAKAGSAASARDSYDGPPTLLGRGRKVKVGAYGGLGAAYTRFMDRDSALMSVEAALLLDHRLSLGAAGYGFTRTPSGPDAVDGTPQEFGAGYGGFVARYSLIGNLPVYGSFGLLLGAGAVNLHRDYGWDEDEWNDEWEHDLQPDYGRFDAFLVVQPELTLHANLTRWLRAGAMVGYRATGGVGRFGLQEADLNGIVTGANLQFGWF
jgi:hypothetical protein